MQKQDLQQIKQLFKDNNEVLLKKIDKKMDEKIDGLAGVVNHGFSELESKMNNKFLEVENGQEEIKLKLDNVAYRFEVVELQKRVEALEKKLNIQFSR